MRQTQTRRRRLRRRFPKGIALPWAAIIILVMVLMVGLSIDMAIAAVGVHQVQNAGDAAALAGAQIVKRSPVADVIDRAWDTANKNQVMKLAVELDKTVQTSDNVDTIDVIVGRWVTYNKTFVPTFDAPNAVRAVVRRGTSEGGQGPISLIFGHMVGTESVALQRDAIAWCNDSSGSGLICLSSSAVPGLLFSGTCDIDVEGGGIHVNSTAEGNNNKSGAWVQGDATIDCGFINVVGGIDPAPESSDWAGYIPGTGDPAGFSVTEGAENLPDPLAATMLANDAAYVAGIGDRLNLPALFDSAGGPIVTHDIPTVTGTATLQPGYYPNGVNINNGQTVTLAPTSASGVGTLFVFGGAGLQVKGQLIGHGVTCYVTKNWSTGAIGATDWAAGAVLDLWSPGDWANKDAEIPNEALWQGLNGVTVWQDPTMVDKKGVPPVVKLNGSPSGGVHGTLYFPDPIHVEMNGDLGQLGNQILCGSAEINGTATISVDYDGRNAGEPTFRSMLVK